MTARGYVQDRQTLSYLIAWSSHNLVLECTAKAEAEWSVLLIDSAVWTNITALTLLLMHSQNGGIYDGMTSLFKCSLPILHHLPSLFSVWWLSHIMSSSGSSLPFRVGKCISFLPFHLLSSCHLDPFETKIGREIRIGNSLTVAHFKGVIWGRQRIRYFSPNQITPSDISHPRSVCCYSTRGVIREMGNLWQVYQERLRTWQENENKMTLQKKIMMMRMIELWRSNVVGDQRLTFVETKKWNEKDMYM